MRFYDLCWAGFLAYYIFQEDDDYQAVMRSPIVKKLRVHPGRVQIGDYRELIVGRYLNSWGSCMVRDIRTVAQRIKAVLTKEKDGFTMLSKQDILTINLDDEKQTSLISGIHGQLQRRKRIGATIASKVMHLMNPGLFFPWDNPMREDFNKRHGYPKSWDDGEVYVEFLAEQQLKAKRVVRDFAKRFKRRGPAEYISKKLAYEPPKTLAKLIDEYNWITLTYMPKGRPIPPSWFPGRK